MGGAVSLRSDFSAADLRAHAKACSDAAQCRRLLALATILEGGSRSTAAKIGGVGLQVVRDWVLRFNAHGPEGLINRKAPGQAPLTLPQKGDSSRCTLAPLACVREAVISGAHVALQLVSIVADP